MYLGHSFLAFAVVAAAGSHLDLDRRRVLVLAGLAAGYGLLPDVDVWRTVFVFLREGPDGVFPTEQHVWQHSWVVHRKLTHSVVTGGATAVASGLAVRAVDGEPSPRRAAGAFGCALLAAGLLFVAGLTAGTPGAVTMGLFLGGALGLAVAGRRRGASGREVTAVAAVGLLTHPFGDFWMGRPPAVLWPVVAGPPLGEMSLSSDPVVHFLGAIVIEVALLGACFHVLCSLYGRPTSRYLSPLALAGFGYAAVLGRVPHPTFAEAYQFATGLFLLSIAVVLLVGRLDRGEPADTGNLGVRDVGARALFTGVAAFASGLVGYAVAYVVAT